MQLYTVVFLLNKDLTKIVLLQRSPAASFAPNRWTGIGGHVEKGEDIQAGALRELQEETGITQNEVKNFRPIANLVYEDGPYQPGGYQISYFDGIYSRENLPESNAGDISWKDLDSLDKLDIIDDTKAAINIFKDQVFGKILKLPLKGKFLTGNTGVTDRVVLI